MRRLNLIDRQFGNLKVIAEAGTSPRGASLWKCYCSLCGNTVVFEGQRLTDKRVPKTNCGCVQRAQRADLTGQTIGGLKVLERTAYKEHGGTVYKCKCLACNQIVYKQASVIKMNLASCGCKHYENFDFESMAYKATESVVHDGINVPNATNTKPISTTTSGYRWVRYSLRHKSWYYFFTIKGKHYVKYGFTSAAEAYEQALSDHATVLSKYGLEHRK